MNTDPKDLQPETTDDMAARKATVTHNLDTGKDEPLNTEKDEEDVMDFASGSDGGSAGDGSAA